MGYDVELITDKENGFGLRFVYSDTGKPINDKVMYFESKKERAEYIRIEKLFVVREEV